MNSISNQYLSLYPGLSDLELLSLNKPAQYLGGELNSVTKDPEAVHTRFALCFPDLYSLGMSHLGINLLYEIANSLSSVWCERVFMPEPDMLELLRSKDLPLCSLESKTPLNKFDIIGFTLQYELCLTNVLVMLDTGSISLLAKDRDESDPIIIAGGPVCFNPAPFEVFFDAFFIGDGETGIGEILVAIAKKNQSRTEKLAALSKIPGVYVPQFSKEIVIKRTLSSLEVAPTIKAPLVPNIRTIHNRLSVEIMRGCARACRFCQAGYIYRPLRERSPRQLLENIDTALKASGFEEVSLLSLSSVDYCQVESLLAEIMDSFAEQNTTSISFPSTRVDAITPSLLEQLKRVRQTAFTIAPEAGSQRLRNVINKQISEEQILDCCSTVFAHGWKGIKLYFMIGLPSETDQDLEAIINLAQQIKKLPEAKGKNITVSVSTFIPKPHTPFQWAEQISPEETRRRQEILYQGLKRAKILLRYHNSFSSMLEGLFSRGSRDLGLLALKAYQNGALLDAWHEHLNQAAWESALADLEIDPSTYLQRRDLEGPLPWDIVSTGAPKSFFLRENQRALEGKTTPNCFGPGCGGCDICNDKLNIKRYTANDIIPTQKPLIKSKENTPISRIRCRYQKAYELRFVGHLELVDIFTRAVKRSNLPICYSQGFHPMARIAFGPPLQLGLESIAEYLDFYFFENLESQNLIDILQPALPNSLEIISAEKIAMSLPSIQQAITSQKYELFCDNTLISSVSLLNSLRLSPDPLSQIQQNKLLRSFNNSADNRHRAKSEVSFNLKDHVINFDYSNLKDICRIGFQLHCDHSKQNLRATDFAGYITGLKLGEYIMRKIDVSFTETKNEH